MEANLGNQINDGPVCKWWKRREIMEIKLCPKRNSRNEGENTEKTQRTRRRSGTASSGYSLLVGRPILIPFVSFYAKMCGEYTLRTFGNNRLTQQQRVIALRIRDNTI